MAEGALDEVLVIDLSQGVSGPYCTKLLADFGAEVIKVEPPGTGDPARRAGPFPGDIPHPEKSGLFLYLNSNKKGITLDLQTEAGRRILKDLVKDADILVENFEPKVMPSLGLDYATLEKINPKLILASITPFGQTGPYRDYKATEIVVQAMGGLMQVTGEQDQVPLKYCFDQAQQIGGVTGANAALTALFHQRVTGEGQHVDVSIIEAMASMYFGNITAYTYTGVVNVRGTNDMYECKDGYVIPAQGQSGTWDDYVGFLGAPELADPKYATQTARMMYNEEIREALEPRFMERERREWFHEAQAMGFSFGFLQTPEDQVQCPQLEARDFYTQMEHPAVGTIPFFRAPFIMTESPWELRRPAPLLGQHNEEIYCGRLGYSKERLVQLRQAGVI